MAFVPAFNTVEAELRYTQSGEKTENTLYFQSASAWGVSTMTALGEALADWWITNIKPYTVAAMGLREVYLTDLTSQDALALSVPVSPVEYGSRAVNPVPNNVAYCISFRTSNRGRSARGRNYVGGIPDDYITQNSVSGTYQTNMVNAYAALIPLAEDLDLTWVVCSRRHNNADRTTATLYLIREAIAIDLTVDSQRRRLPGRGQ